MKIESDSKVFNPVKISITFESIEELEKFYAIFNHVAIVDGLKIEREAAKIREFLKYAGKDVNDDTYFDKLNKIIREY